MAFLVSTTGLAPTVTLYDLGERVITHPTVSLDLSLEFTYLELKYSIDLQNALDAAELTAVVNGIPITTSTELLLTSDPHTHEASGLAYNNATSGLLATNIQDAIDEEDARVDIIEATPAQTRIVVISDPKPGEYTSVKAAVDSILDASSVKPYCVHVGPGVYIEDEIIPSSYISIVGCAIQPTIIKPSGLNHIFTIVNPMIEISYMGLYNAPAGFAAINVDSCGDFAQIHKVIFQDCDTGILIQTTTDTSQFYGEYLDYNGIYSYGTRIISTGGFEAFANLENYYNIPIGSNPIGTSVEGPNAVVDMLANGQLGDGGGTAIYVENGAIVHMSSTNIDSWDRGIHIANVGAASMVSALSIIVSNSTLWDIDIEHVTAVGNFQGTISNHSKINNVSSSVSWNFLDATEGELEITNKLSVTYPNGTHTDLSTLITEGSTSGVEEGGEISDGGGLTVDVAAGFGYFEQFPDNDVMERVDWGATSITLGANVTEYIYFNSSAVLTSGALLPDTRYNILLGRVATLGASIEFIDAAFLNAEHFGNQADRMFRKALGPIYSSGSIVTENATPLHLDVNGGEYFLAEIPFAPSGGTNITFVSYYNNGGGFTRTSTNVVDNGFYNTGGALVALTALNYAKHSLYVIGEGANEKYFLVYSQVQYPTLLTAQEGNIPLPPTNFEEGVVLIAAIIVKQGVGSIVQIMDTRPVIGFRASGVNASSDHGSLSGLADDDHTQYLLANGTRALSGTLNLATNNISNVGTINGLTIADWLKKSGNAFGANAVIGLTDAFSLGIRTNNIDRISISSTGVITIGDLAGVGARIVMADATGLLSPTSILTGTNGGTGVNNDAFLITVSGNFTTTGAFNTTFATGFSGTITLPTATSTLATLALAEALTNKTGYNGLVITANTGVITTGIWNATKIGLLYGGTNADLSATGGAGQYLKQITVGAAITVGTIPASDIVSGAALTRTNDTNVTVTLGGTPASALLVAASLTLGWAGQLAVSRGGTAVSTFGGTNTLLYTTAADTLSSIATANNGVLITSAGGVPSISSTLPNAVQDNITRLGTVTTGVWNGTAIGATFGGTGQTVYAVGDILYASTTTVLSKLVVGINGQVLQLVAGIPAWVTASITGVFADNVFTLQDDGDATKQLQLQLSGITTGTTRTLTVPDYTGAINVRERVFRATLQTTNNTATTIQTVSTASGKSYLVEVRAVSRRISGTGTGANGDTNGYIRYATYKNVGGTVTQVGSQSEYTDEDIGAHNVTFSISGTDVLIRATGSANNTVDWVATTETIEY